MNETHLMETISRSSASFRSLNSKLHMVLYFNRSVFDYNPETMEVRPYNTGQWLTLKDNEEFINILNYIKTIYNTILNRDGPLEDTYLIYGFIIDSIIAIDLNMLRCYLNTINAFDDILKKSSDPYERLCRYANIDTILLMECKKLIKRLHIEYQFWDEELHDSLRTYKFRDIDMEELEYDEHHRDSE